MQGNGDGTRKATFTNLSTRYYLASIPPLQDYVNYLDPETDEFKEVSFASLPGGLDPLLLQLLNFTQAREVLWTMCDHALDQMERMLED